MIIKVTHNSVELKLTLEEVDNLQDIAEAARQNDRADLNVTDSARFIYKKLKDALEAANKLSWMDGI